MFLCNVSCQINGIPLIGETHKEVVNILKELPVNVCLVCSRIVAPVIPDSDEEDDEEVGLTLKELLAEFNDKVTIQTVCELSVVFYFHNQPLSRKPPLSLVSLLSPLRASAGSGLCHPLSYSWGHHQAWRAPHVSSSGHVGERGSGGRAGERRNRTGLQYPGLPGQSHAPEPFHK